MQRLLPWSMDVKVKIDEESASCNGIQSRNSSILHPYSLCFIAAVLVELKIACVLIYCVLDLVVVDWVGEWECDARLRPVQDPA